MKKLAIFLAIMLIPFSAFALDTISDNDLDSVTGQAGVSILTSSIQIVKTGVTTTYTDSNGTGAATGMDNEGNFSIVADATTTQIYFLGFDPLNIDVVNTQDLKNIVSSAAGVAFNGSDTLGDSTVEITLPNAIRIVNAGTSTKTYYAGNHDAIGTGHEENEMIKISTTGGETVYSLAGSSEANQWGNFTGSSAYIDEEEMSALGVKHSDQIKILITSHD
jgi:hypothetical protein